MNISIRAGRSVNPVTAKMDGFDRLSSLRLYNKNLCGRQSRGREVKSAGVYLFRIFTPIVISVTTEKCVRDKITLYRSGLLI